MKIIPVALDPNACDIVLTGHGLGGGTSIVASMDLLDLSPEIITFGAPRTINKRDAGCSNLVAQVDHYQYENLEQVSAYNTQLFDAIPQLDFGIMSKLKHFGTPLIMNGDNVLVLDKGNDVSRASIYRLEPNSTANLPSKMTLYQSRVNSAFNNAQCFPLPAASRYSQWTVVRWRGLVCPVDDVDTFWICRGQLLGLVIK